MLQAQNLSKTYGVTTVLRAVNLIVNTGEHVGLIGPNGSGKSTLLKCLTGQEAPDSGSVILAPRSLRMGYLAQSFSAHEGSTITSILAKSQGDMADIERELQAAADALTGAGDLDSAMERYNYALERFEASGGYEREHRAAAILEGLGLGSLDRNTPVTDLSGGQKTRLGLASLLVQEPDLLLLDEPTNHLDVEALEWLEGFVVGYTGSVLVVSHDREFLDRTVTRILFLDPETQAVKSYPGNYTSFAEAREQEHESHIEAWTRQQEYVGRVKSDISRLKGEAVATELGSTPRQPGVRKLARKKARTAKSRETKLERYLDSEERVEKPALHWWLKLDFGPTPQGGKAALRVDSVSFSYHNGTPILKDVSLYAGFGERIALVGPNGAGKSTLLKLIDGTLKPGIGEVRTGSNIRMGRLSQEQELLQPNWTVLQTVQAERPSDETEARNFLHFFLFSGASVFRKTSECSLGERTRLQLAVLVLRGCNLLLLDEPLNHLDIDGREHFEAALEAFEGTVVVVAHDRAFLHAYPERVIEVKDGGLRAFQGYDEYLAHKEEARRY